MPKQQKLIDVILESAQLVATGPDAEKYSLDLSEESRSQSIRVKDSGVGVPAEWLSRRSNSHPNA